jgi:hypothetical protein
MFSSSAETVDVQRAYDCFANCFVRKPFEIDGYFRLAATIETFWIRLATIESPFTAGIERDRYTESFSLTPYSGNVPA